jgi:hypothetical protein
MPRRDPGSLWNLLGDLWRELSWTMRLCGGVGMLAGLLLGLWIMSHIYSGNEVRYLRLAMTWSRSLWVWITIGLTVVGATLGLALGALIEWLTQKPPPPKPRR